MIPIVFSTDHNYVVPAAVTISSLIRNSVKESYEIIILTDDSLSEDDRNTLKKVVNNSTSIIDFINVGNQFSGAYEVRGITKGTYYRLLLPRLLTQYKKIIYTDVDIIFNGDLTDLYNQEIHDSLIAGVLDPFISDKYKKEIGIKKDNFYVNAGVLIMNLDLMRKQNIVNQFLHHASKQYLYQDQDIINLVCQGKIMTLPPKFNYTQTMYYNIAYKNKYTPFSEEEMIEAVSRPLIIHYTGTKPWKQRIERGEEWWSEYRHSNIFDFSFYKNKQYNNKYNLYNFKNLISMILKTWISKYRLPND